jgi:hypothetical protein
MRNCFCNNKNIVVSQFNLHIVNDIPLNPQLSIYYCKSCNFYYSDSGNNQEDYNHYYSKFNNYKNYNTALHKDMQCANYLQNICKNKPIHTIIDYGSGNCELSNLLSNNFQIDNFDIGMEEPIKKYDCLLLSHVLEHIYDINTFITTISNYISNNGYLYIEVPNAEFYDKITDICPLQEINIEHINFFSKYALNKLLVNHGYSCISLEDDFFLLNNEKYYVIRAFFHKSRINNSFMTYIENGNKAIKNYRFEKLQQYPNIFIYGCGQFLFKIFDNISKNTTITNIIDDNTSYKNKMIDNIPIISFEEYLEKIKSNDIIFITTLINANKIKEKLLSIESYNPIILNMQDLY